jgi:hypothetical protein
VFEIGHNAGQSGTSVDTGRAHHVSYVVFLLARADRGPNLVSSLEQLTHGVTSYESGSTGNKNCGHRERSPNLTLTAPFVARRGHITFNVRNLTNGQHSDPAGDDYMQQAVQQNGRTARIYITFAF